MAENQALCETSYKHLFLRNHFRLSNGEETVMKQPVAPCPFRSSECLQVDSQSLLFYVVCDTCCSSGPRRRLFKDAIIDWNALSQSVTQIGRRCAVADSKKPDENSFASEAVENIRDLGDRILGLAGRSVGDDLIVGHERRADPLGRSESLIDQPRRQAAASSRRQ